MNKNILHRQQIDDQTCTSACLAMILGIDVITVADEFHEGWINRTTNPHKYLTKKGIPHMLNVNPDNDRLTLGVNLITVPSLNFPGLLHHILAAFIDSEWIIFDPQQGRENKKYYVFEEKGNPGEFIIQAWMLDLTVW